MKTFASSLIATGIAIALASHAFAAPPKAPKFDPQRISQGVKTLSDDSFEGRAPATAGEKKTIDWLITQFKAAGVQPGGDMVKGKRTWTQAVPLMMADIKGTPTLSLSSDGKSRTLTQGEDVAIRAAVDGQKHVTLKDAPVVFVGYGVKAPERQWDDFKGMDVRGKVILVLINDPDFETGQGDFGGKAMTYYGRWTYKYEEARRQGAAGVLVVHETAPASYGWPTVKNSNTNTMFDIVRDNKALGAQPMEGWIQRDLAAELVKAGGYDFDTLKKQAQSRDFRPVLLKGQSMSADYAVDSKVITSYNVVGRVPGTQRPDESIIYSAHWDHIGVGLPDAKGDRIYNGAVDNATGTVALVEMARAYAKTKHQRSIVFLAVTAEEKGLLGSEYYASKPLYPLGKTVAMINTDALSPWGPARNFSTSGSAKQELLDQLIETGKRWNMSYVPDQRPEAGSFYRSDHFPMAKRGVPAISFGSGNDLIDGGEAAGKKWRELYTKERYHQPADEWQADFPFTGMARDMEVLYTLGSELANSKQWPNWSKDSEFRAARDASAKQRK